MSKVKWLLTLIFSFNISLISFAQMFETEDGHKRALDSLNAIIKQNSLDTTKVNTLNALFLEMYYWSEEERKTSVNHLQEAMKLSEKIDYKKGLAISTRCFGKYLLDEGNFIDSYKHFFKAFAVSREINYTEEIINCYWNLGDAYSQQKQYSNSDTCFGSALLLAEKSGDGKLISGAYQQLAMYYSYRDSPKYPEAMKYYLMAYYVAIENDLKEYAYGSGNNLGLTYLHLGNYTEALRVLDGLKKFTDEEPFNYNLPIAQVYLGMFQDAIQEYWPYLEQSAKAGKNRKTAECLGQLGWIYFERSTRAFKITQDQDSVLTYLDSALFYIDSSKNLSTSKKLHLHYIINDMNYGKIHKMKAAILFNKHFESRRIKDELVHALTHFQNGLHVTTKNKDSSLMSEYYINLGETKYALAQIEPVKLSKQNLEEAQQLFQQSLTLAKATSNKKASRDAYQDLGMTFNKLGLNSKSIEYLRLYDKMKDSVTEMESKEKQEQIRLMGETIVGATEEKARHDKVMSGLNFEFARREDSIKYLQGMTDEQLKHQMLLAKQQEKDLLLKQASLDLANNQIELGKLNYLKSQAELEAEQSQREEKEKQLTIAEQDKKLQASHLKLQESELALKENALIAAGKQRLFYLGGFVLMAILFFSVFYTIRTRQKTRIEIASGRLKSEKADAAHKMAELELQSLRAQLNPHFMFNSLNAIQELILKEDTHTSHLYLSHFSDLVRMLLDNASQPFIPLSKEIALLELYLSLEKLRIPDLEYYFDIDREANIDDSLIPNMILQPYIENSIWHGLSPKKGDKKLHLRIRKIGEAMQFEIEDNGIGRAKARELKSLYRKGHRSKGMELLSKRFSLMSREFDTVVSTEIKDLTDNSDLPSGTIVEIIIPTNIREKLNFSAHDQSHNY